MKVWLLFLGLLVFGLFLRAGQLFIGGQPFASSESQLNIAPMQQVINGQTAVFKEKALLAYVAIWPYWLLRPLGFTLFDTLYLLLGLFVAGSMAVVFIFGKRIGGARASMLGVLLFAVMPTAVQTQLLSVYTGDFFIGILLMMALLLLVVAVDSHKQQRKALIFGLLSILPLIVAAFLWNGGLYVVATYGFVAALLVLRKFTNSLRWLVFYACILLVCIFVLYRYSPVYVWTDISNINVPPHSDFATVIEFNALTALTQQDMAVNMQVMYIALLLGFALCVLPALWFICMYKGSPDNATVALVGGLLCGLPLALLNARWESLIIMPLAALAGAGLSKVHTKNPMIYTLFCAGVALLALFAVLEVWPYLAQY